jgi:hypothetical protein
VSYVPVRVGPSPIHGLGLFATSFIPKGRFIGPGLFRVGARGEDEDFRQTFITRHVNHWVPGNAMFAASKSPGFTYDLVAVRDVRSGDEIVVDYYEYGRFVTKTAEEARQRGFGSRVRTSLVLLPYVRSMEELQGLPGDTVLTMRHPSGALTRGLVVKKFLTAWTGDDENERWLREIIRNGDLLYERPRGSSVRTPLQPSRWRTPPADLSGWTQKPHEIYVFDGPPKVSVFKVPGEASFRAQMNSKTTLYNLAHVVIGAGDPGGPIDFVVWEAATGKRIGVRNLFPTMSEVAAAAVVATEEWIRTVPPWGSAVRTPLVMQPFFVETFDWEGGPIWQIVESATNRAFDNFRTETEAEEACAELNRRAAKLRLAATKPSNGSVPA